MLRPTSSSWAASISETISPQWFWSLLRDRAVHENSHIECSGSTAQVSRWIRRCCDQPRVWLHFGQVGRRHPVADACFRKEIAGSVAIRLDFASDPLYERPDVIRF